MFFIHLSGQIFSQTTIKDTLIRFNSVDSSFYYSISIPQFIGMKDLKRQAIINEYIWNKVMVSDSVIKSTFSNYGHDSIDLIDQRQLGKDPHSSCMRFGRILLLENKFLCLEITNSYDLWGAIHGFWESEFLNIDLRTLTEINYKAFFKENAKAVFIKYLNETYGFSSNGENEFDFSAIVSLGITNTERNCDNDYAVLFFLKNMADGHGYATNEICLREFKGAVKENSVLFRLLKIKK
jgi:hypothetical protein